MTKGIKVIWPYEGQKNTFEIEYFCGIDVDDLGEIPEFRTVPAVWPPHEPESTVMYNVDVRCERTSKREVRLVVGYDEANNRELQRQYPDYDLWGTNTIVLRQGKRKGHCDWQRSDARKPRRIEWEAFDLEASQGRPRATYQGSRRQAHFRKLILDSDCRRCVLTGENTPDALEAAHLIPAKVGENDYPFNGVALRADLHRLFDAGAFTFNENGEVEITRTGELPSDAYLELLRGKELPPRTLARVQATLTLEGFQKRQSA